MKRLSCGIVLCAICNIAPRDAQGFQKEVKLGEPSCKSCELVPRLIRRLLEPEEAPLRSSSYKVMEDRRGRILMYDGESPVIIVFDSLGKYERTIGRKGRGPGEFLRITTAIVDRADSVHVFDQDAQRYSVLDPAFRFVRSRPMEFEPEFSGVITSQGPVINGIAQTGDRAGYPLHLMTRSGVKSFGSETRGRTTEITHALRRSVTIESDSTLWVAHTNHYEIELWSTSGKLLRRLTREPSWFPATSRGWDGKTEPPPYCIDIQKVGDQLWLMCMVSDRNWKAAIQKLSSQRRGQPHDRSEMFDAVIEVIDTKTGQLLASQRFDRVFEGFGTRPGSVISAGVTEDGLRFIDLSDLRLNQ
jgi:hypothetical protein